MQSQASDTKDIHAFEVLIKDVTSSLNDLRNTDEQHLRRSTIRTIGAAIEGIIFHLKNIALNQATSFPELYSDLEVAALKEETYSVNENGVVQKKTMLIPLKTSIKLIVKIVDKDTKSLHEKSFNNKGWDALIANIEVRNRITHPKKIEDLAITKKEVDQAIKAFHWTLALALRTGDSVKENLKSRVISLESKRKLSSHKKKQPIPNA